MIKSQHVVMQAFLGTLMTWGLTALGSAMVFIFSTGRFRGKRKILDGSLGFAAGVMTAASYWSLLAPAIEKAVQSGIYGAEGEYAFGPVAIGFLLGGGFVLVSDICLLRITKGQNPAVMLADNKEEAELVETVTTSASEEGSYSMDLMKADSSHSQKNEENVQPPAEGVVLKDAVKLNVKKRKGKKEKEEKSEEAPRPQVVLEYKIESSNNAKDELAKQKYKSWIRILLLIIAITVHNIPEGLAVGVAFGAIGTSESATFESARNLAIGIGIQNFPEGMAVSIPLCAAGYTPFKSFWYGQLSGMVEPIFGVLGSLIVIVATPLLPYALAFAAGAMIYVVVDDIIPEANMCGNGRIASWGCMVGFVVMMCLDVGLG